MRTYQWNLGKNCFRSAWFWISIWVNVNSSDKHTGEISGKLNIQNLTCGKHCWFHFNCIRCQDSVIWFPHEWAWVLFHSFYFPISWVENWLTLIPALFPLSGSIPLLVAMSCPAAPAGWLEHLRAKMVWGSAAPYPILALPLLHVFLSYVLKSNMSLRNKGEKMAKN